MSRFAVGTIALLLISTALFAAQGSRWQSQAADSELSFAARYEGEQIPGRFSRFDVRLTVDPETGQPAALAVEVELTSADMNDDEINQELAEPDWFDTARFPTARFVAEEILPSEGGYLANGRLRIKDIEQPLQVPFTWRPGGKKSELAGSVDIQRLTWKVGVGEWAADAGLGDRVQVTFDVTLIRAP